MASWRNNVRKVVPYVPGEQPKDKNVIKLNTNENPYLPSPKVIEAKEKIDRLQMYPDSNVTPIVNELAAYHGILPEEVFVGVGSDDVLAMSFLTFFNSNKKILFPNITYSFYDVWADLFKIPYEVQPLAEDFSINKEDYKKENGGIVFPNPNAPTGRLESVEMIEEIVAANPESVVIIDEAYIDFGGVSVLPLIKKYDNLLVVRTFSKSRALAGMRIGYAMGNKELIKALSDVKQSYNSYTMNQAAITLGVESVRDDKYFNEKLEAVIKTREWFKEELTKLGFVYPDSKANFVFARHPKYDAKQLFEALKKENIFVRYFDKPLINQYLRITIGTDEQMKILVSFLKKYME